MGGRILTSLSLLVPAFSLPGAPPTLSVELLRTGNAPLPPCENTRPVASVPGLTPVTFSAPTRSAGELLRTL